LKLDPPIKFINPIPPSLSLCNITGRKSQLSTEKFHEQASSLLLPTESKEEEHDEAPSTSYSKIIDTLFSPMLRAFTASYKHQRSELFFYLNQKKMLLLVITNLF
jgi:hypothetical protein